MLTVKSTLLIVKADVFLTHTSSLSRPQEKPHCHVTGGRDGRAAAVSPPLLQAVLQLEMTPLQTSILIIGAAIIPAVLYQRQTFDGCEFGDEAVAGAGVVFATEATASRFRASLNADAVAS